MRKILLTILAIILVSFFGSVFLSGNKSFLTEKDVRFGEETVLERIPFFQKTVCEKTIVYSIGNLDERFGLKDEELREIIGRAEKVWEDQMGANLFEYDAQSQFKINLIFDERQRQSMESELLLESYSDLVERQGHISEEHEKLSDQYDFLVSKYSKDVKEYEKEVAEYNEKISDWNEDEEGPSKKEYEKLDKKGEKLRRWYYELDEDRKKINELAEKINKLALKEGQIISEYNKDVETYRERYGEAQEFDQGEYDGKSIGIYQFRGREDLTLVLAHEFGHALGLEHTENPQSVMYYLMGEQDLSDIKLTKEDVAAIKLECEIE